MDWFGNFQSSGQDFRIVDLPVAAGDALSRLPWLMRVLLENVLRTGQEVAAAAARDAILGWLGAGTSEAEISFSPARVLMHDTTCVPALVDIAAMRSTLAEAGLDPAVLNPILSVDVSVDHSVAVDHFGSPDVLARNMAREMSRNAERYRLMKWASHALDNVRIHPPGTGIMHTINLERLATVVGTETRDGATWAMPDTLIGTDSHTPMINALGVLAWGVGGLEAEGVIFGIPTTLRLPDVVGVRLTGKVRDGVLATDLALTVTERLRQTDLAGSFVEFFGPGVSMLSAGERAVVANMAPEYGASSGFFPIDEQTCRYLRATGRKPNHVALVSDYARRVGLWFDPAASPRYTDVVDIDLSRVGVSIAGPRRPQDRLPAGRTAQAWSACPSSGKSSQARTADLPDGAVAIAAITSCTNTTDPRLLIVAGLLARKARQLGLKPPSWVKTSLAPGSPTAERYLRRAGLLDDLSALGFDIVGYGCTTCIGNPGPLTSEVTTAMADLDIRPVAILSGNRNFPGRVHPDLDIGFLVSPPLVIAFALAGDVNRNIEQDPIGRSNDGAPVVLADLWPSESEIDAFLAKACDPADYAAAYERAESSEAWSGLEAPSTLLFPWDATSTYIRRPPFAAVDGAAEPGGTLAQPLLVLGDDITTDHISPAGKIVADSAAAEYLVACGASRNDLNVYAARRGNWEVMLRGMFTNRSIRNLLVPSAPVGHTVHAPSGEVLPIWRAAERYGHEGVPVVVIAGERYGMGSSRDWAAKGLSLLGVRAVLAVSFERIHRSNLIGMGILPLRLQAGHHPNILSLAPGDRIEISVSFDALMPRCEVPLTVHRQSGETHAFQTSAAVETALEVELLRNGGMIPFIIRRYVGECPLRAEDCFRR